jgi:hypothetical protein
MILSLYEACVFYGRSPRTLAATILCSFALQSITISGTVLLGKALGDTALSVPQYFALVPLGFLINAIPMSIAGLGVGEFAFDWLFQKAGSPVGGNLAAIVHALMIGISLFGIIFYLQGTKKLPPPEELEAD